VESNPILVGVLEADSLEFHPVSMTSTWNWQQGSMLQWVGCQDHILFNDHVEDHNVARLMTSSGETVDVFPIHIASVSPDGRYGLSYSFARMRRTAPEYSYQVGDDPSECVALPRDDGLRLIDLQNGDTQMLYSLAELAYLHPEVSMKEAYHYLTHCLFSPTGRRFTFLHRWRGQHGVLHTRLWSSDLSGQHLHQFPVTHASHICWRDNERVFAYCKPRDRCIGYYLMRDLSQDLEFAGTSLPACDGHPQFSRDGRFLVTDTYPDRGRVQSLLVHDTLESTTQVLVAVRIGFEYRYNRRCDFHPRWNHDATQICFDSAHSGIRSLFVMDVPGRGSSE